MKPNEKAATSNNGLAKTNEFTNQLTMSNNTRKQPEFQFDSAIPPKVFEIIQCCDCGTQRELDGFRFKLMPVCSDCRTERSLEILAKQIERRAKK